jgi:N-acetylglucosamine kinase-like BadF-type ATPase
VVDLIDILASDRSAEVRHKTVILLARFVGRDARAGEAIARASIEDTDTAIRHVARRLMEHGQPLPLRRKGALRAVRRERRRRSAAQAHD